jgi:hypothetical protein
MNKLTSLALAFVLACTSSTDGADGMGSVAFTTYGEDFIEKEIGPGGTEEAPIVDGWTVKYERFLIVLGDVAIAEDGRSPIATMPAPRLFDMKKPGQKAVFTAANLPGKPYTHVSFTVRPATAATENANAAESDKKLMADNGYSVYVEGTLTKDATTKKFAWGFKTSTLYDRCKGERDGKETDGVVVTNGGTDTVELTIHGDHLFYDHLQSAEAQVRVENIALADANTDGTVTLEELATKRLADLPPANGPYGTGSASNVNDLRAFVEALSRTLGHFRGEGECLASAK